VIPTGERRGETGEHQLFAFLTRESNEVVRPSVASDPRSSTLGRIVAVLESEGAVFYSDGSVGLKRKAEPFVTTPAATPDAVRKVKALLAGSRRARGLLPEFDE
jgi:hypothetical protein